MDLLLIVSIGFIVLGLAILILMKRSMESKLAYIKANREEDHSKKVNAIILWIMSVALWGVVSINFVVYLFQIF